MIRTFVRDKNGKFYREDDLKAAHRLFKHPKINAWVDFENPTDEELRLLGSLFKFHPLAIEDVLSGKQRPKVEEYEDYEYIVLRTPSKDFSQSHQFNVFLGKGFIVTVNRLPVAEEDAIIGRAQKNPEILDRGADFVLYTLFDAFVDAYFPIMKELDDQVEKLENEIVSGKMPPDALHRLIKIKRRAANVRRIVWPLRDLANNLARPGHRFISDKNVIYFRDVYDHLVRIVDQVDVTRDLITSSMEAYLSVVSNSLNVVMKKLTAIATILFVPALIAGIYGMNFQNMPELKWEHGYYYSLGLMALVTAGLAIYFRKREWL